MAINLRQLEAFRAVVMTGSITAAAAFLHVSQPAVSRLIADLERRIGFPLFERRNRRLCIRPEGELFYREVDKSFVGIAKIAQKAAEIRDFKTGHLRIAGMPAVSLGLLPAVIRSFKDAFPDVVVSLQIRTSQKVMELLAGQQFDLGLAALPLGEAEAAIEALEPPDCVAVLPRRHRLADKAVIVPEDLAGETFISLGADSMLRARIDKVFQEAGVRRNMAVETPMSASALLMAAQGVGVAIIEPFTAAGLDVPGVAMRPFAPPVPYEFGLLFPRQAPRARITDAFIAAFKQHLTRFGQEAADRWAAPANGRKRRARVA